MKHGPNPLWRLAGDAGYGLAEAPVRSGPSGGHPATVNLRDRIPLPERDWGWDLGRLGLHAAYEYLLGLKAVAFSEVPP
jgi:hypothetical protein